MQDLIKRYFWVLGGAVVLVCVVFAAKATSNVLEAKLLNDTEHTPKLTAVAQQAVVPVKSVRNKNGDQLASRDMFCSDCKPTEVVHIDNGQIQMTSLPLLLLATNVAPEESESSATIINTENQRQGAFGIGDKMPGASGAITHIHYKFVDFENAGHIERIGLAGQPAPPTTPVAQEANEENKDEMQAAIDSGIKKIDDTHYEIDKSLVDKVLLNPMAVAKGARVVPAVKNGKPDGFKLYAIRPNSVYAKLGLQNGDTLQSINGFELTTADKALEVYTKLREATSLQVDVTRRGSPSTLNYKIR
ncbi:MAG TPA: type II secretion system protein GspC [Kofleriaceae bacterium]|jgi:general secretion pathway protein C|nr:type II secretion system protein GspC [Kofleriaceae bacterium]